MGTEIDTAAAVQADIDIAVVVAADRVDRTGQDAFTAADAQFFSHDYPTPRTLAECAGRAGGSAGSRVTPQAD